MAKLPHAETHISDCLQLISIRLRQFIPEGVEIGLILSFSQLFYLLMLSVDLRLSNVDSVL